MSKVNTKSKKSSIDKSDRGLDNRKSQKRGKFSKGKSYDDKYSKAEDSVGRNDVSWYTPDIQLLNDAGRWPYSRPVGTPLNRTSVLHLADARDYAVPGIAAAKTYLTYGKSENGQSALNVAANAVYTYVRHLNSGSRNYDANDLMLYIGALDSIYTFVTFVTRAYATVGMYASMNKYLPDALGRTQALDLNSIRVNMANFRAQFNSLLLKVGTLIIPDTMPIFKRHSYLFQNYYSEGTSIKDQIYFYYPANVYKFQLDSSGAGMLKNVEIADYFNVNGVLDAAGIIKVMEDLITPIFNDEDFNIMSGDILKAYEGKVMGLMLLPDLLVAQPINNIVALEQFKNIKCLYTDAPTASGILDVTQDVNKEYLIADFSDFGVFKIAGDSTIRKISSESANPDLFKIALDEWSRPRLLTTEVSDPTPEVNMLNTRNVVNLEISVDSSRPSGLCVTDYAFGSEFISRINYGYYDSNWILRYPNISMINLVDTTDNSQLASLIEYAAIISSFRFHPEHTVIGFDITASPTTFLACGIPLFGIDNFTSIDFEHVSALHDVAILGEYNVPRLAVVK